MKRLGRGVALVVHGGAWNIPVSGRKAAGVGCERAASAGLSVLSAGGSALDAVEAAVRELENDPQFDAGTGSVLTSAGKVEQDAAIVDGETLDAGGVCSLGGFEHPVSIARKVMESDHVLLAGPGADAFAQEHGFSPAAPGSLVTAEAQAEFDRFREYGGVRDSLFNLSAEDAQSSRALDKPSDTVGAAAVDSEGRVAAATSTGGISLKLPGRVGDSPLLCSGVSPLLGTSWQRRETTLFAFASPRNETHETLL